jgi:hypothetical protein
MQAQPLLHANARLHPLALKPIVVRCPPRSARHSREQQHSPSSAALHRTNSRLREALRRTSSSARRTTSSRPSRQTQELPPAAEPQPPSRHAGSAAGSPSQQEMLGAGPTFRDLAGAPQLAGATLQQQGGPGREDGQQREQPMRYQPGSAAQAPWQQQHALLLQQEALLQDQQHSPGSASVRDRVRRRSTMLSIPPLQAAHLELNSQVGLPRKIAAASECLRRQPPSIDGC